MWDKQSARRLGSLIPMLLFTLFFVICSGVLAAVFLRSAQISAYAGQRSDAVQLCRNAAERFRAGETLPEGKQFYGKDFVPAEEASGDYLLEVTCQREGQLMHATIAASTSQGTPLYTLNATRYAPGGR